MNKLLNAMIALIENRPEVARTLLRSPDMKAFSIGEVQSRLHAALDRAKAGAIIEALRQVMHQSLRLTGTLDPGATEQQQEAFLKGVAAVESILEHYIEDTKLEVLP